jgi:hypothetical protein
MMKCSGVILRFSLVVISETACSTNTTPYKITSISMRRFSPMLMLSAYMTQAVMTLKYGTPNLFTEQKIAGRILSFARANGICEYDVTKALNIQTPHSIPPIAVQFFKNLLPMAPATSTQEPITIEVV